MSSGPRSCSSRHSLNPSNNLCIVGRANATMKLHIRCTLLLCVFAVSAVAPPPQCASKELFSVSQFCNVTGLIDDADSACPVLSIVGNVGDALPRPPKCRTSASELQIPPDSAEDSYGADSYGGTVLPQDLPDIRTRHTGLPQTLDYKAYMKSEGATYFWYYRNLLNLASWSPCPIENSTQKIGLPLPDGWLDVDFFDLEAPAVPGKNATSYPFGILLKPNPSYSDERRDSCKRWYAQAATKASAQSTPSQQSKKGSSKATPRTSTTKAAHSKASSQLQPHNNFAATAPGAAKPSVQSTQASSSSNSATVPSTSLNKAATASKTPEQPQQGSTKAAATAASAATPAIKEAGRARYPTTPAQRRQRRKAAQHSSSSSDPATPQASGPQQQQDTAPTEPSAGPDHSHHSQQHQQQAGAQTHSQSADIPSAQQGAAATLRAPEDQGPAKPISKPGHQRVQRIKVVRDPAAATEPGVLSKSGPSNGQRLSGEVRESYQPGQGAPSDGTHRTQGDSRWSYLTDPSDEPVKYEHHSQEVPVQYEPRPYQGDSSKHEPQYASPDPHGKQHGTAWDYHPEAPSYAREGQPEQPYHPSAGANKRTEPYEPHPHYSYDNRAEKEAPYYNSKGKEGSYRQTYPEPPAAGDYYKPPQQQYFRLEQQYQEPHAGEGYYKPPQQQYPDPHMAGEYYKQQEQHYPKPSTGGDHSEPSAGGGYYKPPQQQYPEPQMGGEYNKQQEQQYPTPSTGGDYYKAPEPYHPKPSHRDDYYEPPQQQYYRPEQQYPEPSVDRDYRPHQQQYYRPDQQYPEPSADREYYRPQQQQYHHPEPQAGDDAYRPTEQYYPGPDGLKYNHPQEQQYHPQPGTGDEYYTPPQEQQYYPPPSSESSYKPPGPYYPQPGAEDPDYYQSAEQYYPESQTGSEYYNQQEQKYYSEGSGPSTGESKDGDSSMYEDSDSYGWESDRYDEDYSCGKDYSEGTNPHMILLLRGAVTEAEYMIGGAYKQVNESTGLFGPGKYAEGYAYLAQYLWANGLRDTIEREIDNGCRSITIAGHSLGAAVGQLLAVAIEGLFKAAEEDAYGPNFGGAKPAQVTVLTFGSPNVGNPEWADNFNKKINARQIAFEGDLLPQLPCQPQQVGCSRPFVPYDSTPGPWYYQRAGGNIVYPGAAMPFNSKYNVAQSWSALSKLSGAQLCSPTYAQAFIATHICSYLCMTSPYGNEDDNRCWLDVSSSPPYGASQCTSAGINGGVPPLR